MDVEARIAGVVKSSRMWLEPDHLPRAEAVRKTLELDNRFTFESIAFAVNQQLSQLRPDRIRQWLGKPFDVAGARVGALLAGNIPFVGLQDLVATVLVGGRYRGAVSSRSPFLLQSFAGELSNYLDADVEFFSGTHDERLAWLLAEANAVVATGDDTTTELVADRCLLAGIDHLLLRKSTYSIAVVDGSESVDDLERLAEDAFLHDGQGCRSVAILFAPKGMAVDPFLESANHFRSVFPANVRTVADVRRQAALLQAVGLPCGFPEDLSFLVSRGDPDTFGAGHLRWTTYDTIGDVGAWISQHRNELQLVVCTRNVSQRLGLISEVDTVRPGDAQRPVLTWAPDGNSIVDFLRAIHDRISQS